MEGLLPATLPADVSQAATANGGAINAVAHLDGQTASGQIMRGTDFVMAAPASAPAAARALVTSAAEDDTPSRIRPVTEAMMQESPQPNEVQTAHSWASRGEQNSVDTLGEQPLPEYQSDTSGLPQGDPYIVKGVDTKAMEVRPMDGGCDRTKTKIIDRQIRYTAVVEGHAAWDSKATVKYDSKLSTNIEVAVKTGSNWTIEGSVTLGSAISASTATRTRARTTASSGRSRSSTRSTRKRGSATTARTRTSATGSRAVSTRSRAAEPWASTART